MLTEEQKLHLAKKKLAKTEEETPGFDLRNRITDKNGEVTLKQDYFIHLRAGQQYFERPVGSGNLFFLSGQPAGRLETSENGMKTINDKAEHIEFYAPLDADGELFEQLKATQAESEALRRELDAIKKEKAFRARELELRGQGTAQRNEARAAKEGQT